MLIREITNFLEQVAPPVYQEGYDNAGLITGRPTDQVSGIMCCLDATEAVIDEAIATGCNLVLAHHPIVFKGLKRFNGRNYVERVIIKAIKHDVAIYAIHTNLDNAYYSGVNTKIAEKMGLVETRVLAPKQAHLLITAWVSIAAAAAVRLAMTQVGATTLPSSDDTDTWSALGIHGNSEPMMRIEARCLQHQQRAVCQAISGADSAAELFVQPLLTNSPTIGAGMVGKLPEAMPEADFLTLLKKTFGCGCIKHTQLLGRKIETVALCGGSGGFLLPNALAAGADIFVTADYKYHEFFDADGRIIIADIGHYESEQFTIDLLAGLISEKFANFAPRLTTVNTNPVFFA